MAVNSLWEFDMQSPSTIRKFAKATSRAFSLAMRGDDRNAAYDCEVTEYFLQELQQPWEDTTIMHDFVDAQQTVPAPMLPEMRF